MRLPSKENLSERDSRIAAFFYDNFNQYGTAAAVADAYVELFPQYDYKSTADTFRDYVNGTTRVRLPKAWDMARAIRKGTQHDWCAGPVMLYACSEFNDLVKVLYSWGLRSAPELRDLIDSLPHAVGCDSQTPGALDRARRRWALNDDQSAQLQAAWEKPAHMDDSPYFIQLGLLASESKLTIPQKSNLVMMCLAGWASRSDNLLMFVQNHPEYHIASMLAI